MVFYDDVIHLLILFLNLCGKIKTDIMINIDQYFCTNEQCKCYGLRSQGNLIKAGTYIKQGETKQMFKCKICGSRFSETRNTIFFNSRYDSATIGNIIRCIAEGNGIRATATILGLSKDAVNAVVLKAGRHADAMMCDLLRNLHLTECQMDVLWRFINKKNAVRRGVGTWSEITSYMDSNKARNK
jgi:transposase-like protein